MISRLAAALPVVLLLACATHPKPIVKPPTFTTGTITCKQVHIVDTDVTESSFTNGVDFPIEGVCAGDTIVWRIHNGTGGIVGPAEAIEVKVHKFEDRYHADGKSLHWRGDNRVTIEPGYTGVIVGVFPGTEHPGQNAGRILVEYWTKLKGKRTGREKELDPDLEVDPPPST
jgi:hypothetical protein